MAALGLRQEAFSLLNKLCQDSLEVPLASVLQHPGGGIGDAFGRLFDIVEQLTGEIQSIHSRALDETLSHEERLLAIERLSRVRF